MDKQPTRPTNPDVTPGQPTQPERRTDTIPTERNPQDVKRSDVDPTKAKQTR